MRHWAQLLRTLVLRPLARDPLRSALTIISIALGVGVVIAIDLSGQAATGSFRNSLTSILGKTDYSIVANGGVDEKWMGTLAALPLNAHFTPVIESSIQLPELGFVTLYGVDTVAEAQQGIATSIPSGCAALVAAQDLARRWHHQLNDRIHLFDRDFCLIQIVDARNGGFIGMDIAEAQRILHGFGTVDHIDIRVDPQESAEAVQSAVRRVIPAAYQITESGTRSRENQRMLRAFRWNLQVLSYVSLVVGAFLIYNTVAVSVVRRRPEIGILRALGTGRQGIFWLFLSEALLLGLAGSLVGLLLGRFLAQGMVTLISQTINALYTTSRPAAIEFTGNTWAVGLAAGLAASFVSAFAPAREAMAVTPTEAMSRGSREQLSRSHLARNTWLAALATAAAAFASQMHPINGRPLFGYAATLLSIVAAALLAPLLVVHVTHWLRPAAHRWFGVGAFLGARGLTASLGRTSVVVAALATSIAMMASMGVLVGSFRETVLVWLGQQLRADLYLRGSGPTAVGAFPPLPANVEPTLRKLPQIEAIDVFAGFDFRYGEDRATLGATDTEVARRFGRTRLLPGENYDRVMRSLPNQNNVVISEPFANKHNLRAGDPIQLNIGSTVAQFHVAGIYYEYSSERGYVLMDRTILNRYMPGAPLTNIGIYLKPGQNADIAQQQIEAALATFPVAIARNRELRAGAVEIFDRTFAVTYAMELIAILVAMLGAANSLLALVLDRRREIGTLRYLGASTQQIRAMVLTEAAFIGGLATILGVALGAALSLLLIYVMNKQSFGWTIQLHPPYLLLVGALLLIWVVTVLAGLYPARVAGRLNPIQVIHEE
jgi:putative ABC transport system permease protein